MMLRDVNRFAGKNYDVIIIGGGINGAAVAHLAALNGLKVALLEKDDFAAGTSSKSTKLIHGGLRYLEHFEFDLVRESLKERHILLRDCSHLVKPLSFIIPVYRSDARPLWMMKLGVALYDFLSGKYVIKKHRSLSVDEIVKVIPEIKSDGLVGGVRYSDAQMDDARLCLENVLSAQEKGADVMNYIEARSVIKENGKAVGVIAYDRLADKIFEIRAKQIVSAVGPWTNIFSEKEKGFLSARVRTTKGVHIVYRGQMCRDALLLPTQNERRVFFIIPWMGHSLIGTTDTDFNGTPDEVSVGQEDIDYLLSEASRVFTGQRFTRENIITTFAGLRPLVYEKGHPSQVSRKHVISRSHSGIVYVMGGKYTTFRKIAEDTLKVIGVKNIKDTESHFFVYGSGPIAADPVQEAKGYGLSADVVRYLMDFYGTRFTEILRLVKQDAGLKQPICTCSMAIRAQVVYAVQNELACCEDDIIARRISLVYRDCPTKKCLTEIRQIFKKYKT